MTVVKLICYPEILTFTYPQSATETRNRRRQEEEEKRAKQYRTRRESNSAVNRKKQQRQIGLDNEVLVRKIKEISARKKKFFE